MKRVLVVDDNADLRESLRQLLIHAGYDAETASDGQQAMRMHLRRDYQVLVTDIYMPHSDGLETIQAFRSLSPGIRIVAISGGGIRSTNGHLGVATEAGADATLQKPFDFAALLAALQ
jgi:DNA-binding response OmpR family regulator